MYKSRGRRVMADDFVPGVTERREGQTGVKLSKWASLAWTTSILLIGILLVVLFLHLDRDNKISLVIRSTGAFGIIIAVVLMALFCVIPVPSEFLMIMNMKVFGVWWGILYTWMGAMIGAVAVFLFARHFGRHLLHAFIGEEKFQQVNDWIANKGAMGLLLARLVPLPFIVVNYAAGVLKSVRTTDYVWTTAVGLIPYDVGAALVFIGFSKRFTIWLIVGGVVVIAIWATGYFINRRAMKRTNDQDEKVK